MHRTIKLRFYPSFSPKERGRYSIQFNKLRREGDQDERGNVAIGQTQDGQQTARETAYACVYPPFPQELFGQRVSFAFGLMNTESNVTRDQIRRMLEGTGFVASLLAEQLASQPDPSKISHIALF